MLEKAIRLENVANILSLMEKFGKSVDDPIAGNIILVEACLSGNKEFVLELLECCSWAQDIKDVRGWTPVRAAVHSGSSDLLLNLLSLGYHPDIQALEFAANWALNPQCELLLAAGTPLCNFHGEVDHRMICRFRSAGWRQDEENIEFQTPTEVKPLMIICRNAVRRHLNTEMNFIVQVEKLPLPTALKGFVLLGE